MGVGVRRAGRLQKVVLVKDVVFFSWGNTKPLPHIQRNIVCSRQYQTGKHSFEDFWKDNQIKISIYSFGNIQCTFVHAIFIKATELDEFNINLDFASC